MSKSYRRAELLGNGFVRVECTSGLVRMRERNPNALAGVSIRSGQGQALPDEVMAVQCFLIPA